MLSPADADLVRRDPAVPGLAVLLDDDAVRAFVGAPVLRRYLRYKPGTSCVLGATVELDGAVADVFVTAYDDEGAVKIDKVADGAPPGSVLASDPARGVVAATASADRDLPFLALLADPRRRRRALRRLLPDLPRVHAARLSTLSYKPMRRWVGLLEPAQGPAFVLRAYRPADVAGAAAAVRELAEGAPRTPRLLADDPGLGVLVLEYIPGRTLDDLLDGDAVPEGVLAEAGRALAALHQRVLPGLPMRPTDNAAAARAAAEQVGLLLPELASDAARLGSDLAARLAQLPVEPSVVHGDFSADQVVVAGAGAAEGRGAVALLDFDRAAQGDPAADLASLYAARLAGEVLRGNGSSQLPRELLSQVTVAYATTRAVPPAQAVTVHAAALLLRRVVDPFRLCAPEWQQSARALFAAAALAAGVEGPPGRAAALPPAAAELPAAAEPLSLSPADLLLDLVGEPLRLDVLKDKPGRRRTSRATGPGGTAIVKVYASDRAPVVAARVGALRDGPAEPVLPRVLRCDEARHVVVLTDVPGAPYRDALLAGDLDASARVGHALGAWHAAHRGRVPAPLRAQTVEREIATVLQRAQSAPAAIGDAVRVAVPALSQPWDAVTVVHRDLYEEQIVLGALVGLLDLDDAAAGPGELDLGNLLAHLRLLSRRSGHTLDQATTTLLTAYADVAPLDAALLGRCEALSLLRLACLHRDEALLATADESVLISGSPDPHAEAG